VANSLAGVCLTWRAAILAEDSYLQGVHFKLEDAAQPFRGLAPVRGAVAHRRTWQTRDRRFNDIGAAVVRAGANSTGVPKVLARAAECHNVSALETLGTLRDMQGDHAAAFKAWKKSAMLGSSVGQFKLGEIFYRGLGNQGVDGEEALFWLCKVGLAVRAGATRYLETLDRTHVTPAYAYSNYKSPNITGAQRWSLIKAYVHMQLVPLHHGCQESDAGPREPGHGGGDHRVLAPGRRGHAAVQRHRGQVVQARRGARQQRGGQNPGLALQHRPVLSWRAGE
jgi:hypothetical protein